MKKMLNASFILLSVALLSACSTPKDTTTSDSTVESSTIVSSTKEEEMVTIFTATVESVTELETQDAAIQILLKEAKAVEDTEEVTGSFNDGVALNVDPATLDFDFKELKAGDQVKVTLSQPAMMTMSIPPQIPGNSIISVELLK